MTIPRRLLTVLAFAATAAHAQDETPPETAPAIPVDDTGQMETVVVTARKREEKVIDIPESIQAFSGDRLEDSGVQTAKDLARVTPNFGLIEAQQPGVVLINIRGIGQLRMGEAPIAVVIDGVQSSISNEITQDLFDIQRMEVLKGPQGSIYGRNAIGGAINIVTAPPTNTFQAKLKGTVGNGDDERAGGQVSGPIIDDVLLFRVSGQYRKFGGLIHDATIDDTVDDERSKSGRASLVFLPTEDLSFTLTGNVDDIRAGASYYAPFSLVREIGQDRDISDPNPVVMDHKGLGTRRIGNVSLKGDWVTPIGTLTSVSAYAHLHSFLDEDLDWTAAPLLSATQEVDNNATSEELRMVSPDDGGPFQWLFGLYWLGVDRQTDTVPYVLGDVTDLLGLGLPAVQFVNKHFTDDNKSYAAFGHASYSFTEALQLGVGMRYDIEDRSQLNLIDRTEVQAKFKSLQPKVSLDWKFADAMAYATIGKGFRSGGFNPTDQVGRKFKNETLWNYELGLKTPLMDNRAAFEAAVFYTDIKDRQVYTLDLLTVSQLIANPIPKSHIIGAEMQLSARPLQHAFVGIGLGALKSKIDTYDPSIYAGTVAEGDFKGNQLNQVPGFSYNAVVEYTQPIAQLSLVAHADFNGSAGDYFWEIDNEDRRAPQNFTNVRLTLKGSGWSLGAFCDNVFEEKYVVEFVPYEFSGGLSDLGLPSRPRRYGAELSFEF